MTIWWSNGAGEPCKWIPLFTHSCPGGPPGAQNGKIPLFGNTTPLRNIEKGHTAIAIYGGIIRDGKKGYFTPFWGNG